MAVETKNFPSAGWMTNSVILHLPGGGQIQFREGCHTRLAYSTRLTDTGEEDGDFIGLTFYTDEISITVPFANIPEMCRALPGIVGSQHVYFDGIFAAAERKTCNILKFKAYGKAHDEAIAEAKRLGCTTGCFSPDGTYCESDEMYQYFYCSRVALSLNKEQGGTL